MMSLYGVLTSMTIDYNEWKYDKKMVAMTGGAIGFGSKVRKRFGRGCPVRIPRNWRI